MSLAVVFLPDTALLVPGAAGRADPAAGLRTAAVAALAGLAGAGAAARVLVVAPARRDRVLRHPVAAGLGAAGLDLPDVPDLAPVAAARADVPASVALVLLRAAGVAAPVDVLELGRAGVGTLPELREPPGLPEGPRAIVVVGSLSARHGPDAPLADDPRAPAADDDLLAALASGPAALARALDGLGPDGARDLAVSGGAPWRAVLSLLPEGAPAEAEVPRAEVVAGAQHAVAVWRLADPAAPAALTEPAAAAAPAAHPRTVPPHPEEPR